MNIENLVPSLELCQKIPDGEFDDAALAWIRMSPPCNQKFFVSNNINLDKKGYIQQSTSAPMLQEILQRLPIPHGIRIDVNLIRTVWYVDTRTDKTEAVTAALNTSEVDAALKLWLKWKGIE